MYYYYTLSCPHSAILATVIMSEEQNSRLLRKISRLFLRIRKWFLNRPETVSSMNNIIPYTYYRTTWNHLRFRCFFSSNKRIIFFSNPWMSLPSANMLRFIKKNFFAKNMVLIQFTMQNARRYILLCWCKFWRHLLKKCF